VTSWGLSGRRLLIMVSLKSVEIGCSSVSCANDSCPAWAIVTSVSSLWTNFINEMSLGGTNSKGEKNSHFPSRGRMRRGDAPGPTVQVGRRGETFPGPWCSLSSWRTPLYTTPIDLSAFLSPVEVARGEILGPLTRVLDLSSTGKPIV